MNAPSNELPTSEPRWRLDENPRVSESHKQAAEAAFQRELPELLKMRGNRRRWVMYHGDKRVGFGANTLERYQLARRTGLDESESAVMHISDGVPSPDIDDLLDD